MSLKEGQNHKRDKDSRVIPFFFKMLSLEVSWSVLKHSGVPLARRLFFFFMKVEDCLVCMNQMSTENCVSINPNKMPYHKKAVENHFYPPPSYLSTSVSEIIIWCTAVLVCYHSGDSQGRVKSLRRKIMVTITAMFMAVSQIQ